MTTTTILILLLTCIGILLCIVIARLMVANYHEERRFADTTRRLGRAMAIHSKLMFL